MAISDGQRVRAQESNAAWASKSADNTMTGVQSLEHPTSGGNIANAQQKINDIQADLSQAETNITALQSDVSVLQSDVADLQAIDTFVYMGEWDAATNTPALADGDGGAGAGPGAVFRTSVAGTQDLGSGNLVFSLADRVVYNSAGVWEKWDVTDEVTSVNGYQGDVILELDDIDNVDAPSPTDNQYLKFNNGTSKWEPVDLITESTKVEYRTITAGEASNKELTLIESPKSASEVMLDIISGGPMFYGSDFSVLGLVLTWDGLGLDGLLASGDRVRIVYAYE
jgi:hypothetical protein